MTTPQEWLRRTVAVVDQQALLFAGWPDYAVDAALDDFAERMRKGWRKAFASLPIAQADADSMVADVVGRIRKRRREIEAGGRAGRG